ncbi:unnamed protein product [Ostreobium quekettii]|uniref:Protein-tyrosine-phosphatase n=1 Tax=Ostreobium quekettii TaxID=121088 RepID=A0A8S1JIV6_9CHLO|nr:unnamed protein product [Ostreobium quekettii]|eukprot:evm.model.scf_242.1 EVM.evm.TU.scf_242.1   scf_242:1889-8610(-)
MAVEVVPGLYIGSIEALDREVLRERRITHVLTVMNCLVDKLHGEITHKHIYVPDDFTGNLLIHLPTCVEFIGDALTIGGHVLVHCYAGISRSSTVVTAYVMATDSLSRSAALKKVRKRYPIACPNPSFVQQLRLFHAMGYRIDPYNSDYKMFKLRQKNNQYKFGSAILSEMQFAVLPRDEEDGPHALVGDNLYRCRPCGCLLATSLHILSCTKEDEAALFQEPCEDTSLFVEPVRWMEGVSGSVDGKLHCPQCGTSLGSFSWAGMQDDKGTWYVPAFKLRVRSLDIVQPTVPPWLRSPRLGAPGMGSPKIGDQVPSPVPQQRGTDATRPPAATGAAGPAGRRFDCLVLDCEGVMVDSAKAACIALSLSILSVTGFDAPHEYPQDYLDVWGMDLRDCVQHYKDKFDRTAWNVDDVARRAVAEMGPIYRELTSDGIEALPGVVDLVEAAKRGGVPVGVGSSCAPECVMHGLKAAGLEGLIHGCAVVSGQQVARGKPAPDMFVEALTRLGCSDPSRAMVVEGAIHGLRAAKAAGALAVGVSTSLPRDVLEPHADIVVDSLEELVQFF